MRACLLSVAAGVLAAGCAGLFPGSASPSSPARLLARADDRMAAAEYRSAVTLYDEYLQTNPGDPGTTRARATRAALERLLLAQGEVERLRREVDRLKADLERLRSIDLRQTPAPR
ncbi:MAG TPA: hypothetical protein VGX21_07145 [Methylomirabilota bacterium]|jgi:hypothetical protein|nr:hypothetical protein [Methylomirabilota bacterium]